MSNSNSSRIDPVENIGTGKSIATFFAPVIVFLCVFGICLVSALLPSLSR